MRHQASERHIREQSRGVSVYKSQCNLCPPTHWIKTGDNSIRRKVHEYYVAGTPETKTGTVGKDLCLGCAMSATETPRVIDPTLSHKATLRNRAVEGPSRKRTRKRL